MARFIDDRSAETLFVNGSLDSLLPGQSVARVIHGALAELDFSAFEASYCNDEMGRRAVDPRRLVAVWILGMLRGITSSVVLARLCGHDIEFRWLLGDAPVQKSTLSDFRKRHVEALSELSAQVLAALARSGQLPAEDLVVDGTIVQAASSCHKNASRMNLRKRVARLKDRIAETLAAPEEADEDVEKLEKQVAHVTEALAEMDRMGLRQAKDRITLTEPEASLKKLKRGDFAPAHNVQAVTDAANGAIVHVEVVDQGNDQGQLGPQVNRAMATLREVREKSDGPTKAVQRIAADGAYHDTTQLAELAGDGITPVVPNGLAQRHTPNQDPAYAPDAFTHNPDTDTLTCPEGHELRRAGFNKKGTAAKYRARASACQQCPAKAQCCPETKSGRSVNRPLHGEIVERVEAYTRTPDGQRMLRARHVTGEGIFARMKDRLHWARCRTWGRRGAHAEALWRQLTHNLMLLTGQWQPIVLQAQPGG